MEKAGNALKETGDKAKEAVKDAVNKMKDTKSSFQSSFA